MKVKHIYVVHKIENHPIFSSLYYHPPKNLKIVYRDLPYFEKHGEGLDENISLYQKSSSTKRIFYFFKLAYFKLLEVLNFPIIILILPSKNLSYDYLLTLPLVLSTKKFITFVNYLGMFVNWDDARLNSKICLSIIRKLLLSNRCKYVFNLSKSSKKMLIDVLRIPKNKQSKFKTLYPSMEPKDKIIRNNESIRLLFIAASHKWDPLFNFYMKGGKLVLKAYEKLKPKYKNIELIYIGKIPLEYENLIEKIPDIKRYLRVPYEKVLEFYNKSDIFLFPTYGDVFGFAFIEAMAHGLPIICIDNNYAATEMVINNETGFVIQTSQKFLAFPFSKYCPDWLNEKKWHKNIKKEDDIVGLKNFTDKLEILIQNKDLREKFGENGRKRLVDGDLSIMHRNRKLYDLFSN